MATLRLSPEAANTLLVEKISGEEIEHMVKYSAKATLEGCNRRFHQWLFDVRGDREDQYLHAMKRWPRVTVGSKTVGNMMIEEHEACEGAGCSECNWWKEVERYV